MNCRIKMMDAKYIKTAFKIFMIFVIAGLLVQAISFGVYWYNRKNFGEAGKYKEEKDRCERVLAGEEGDLTDYSYCKRYIEWLDENINIDN